MTPLDRLDRLRAAFPLLEERAYLFSGGIAPLATEVRAAMTAWTDQWAEDPLTHRADYFGAWTELRSTFAALVGVGPDDVAITENTSRATNLAVRMLAPAPGSNILVDATTYPSSAWAFLAQHDVGVRLVLPDPGEAFVDALARVRDDATRCVAVSHVAALDGQRHDLDRLATYCSETGLRLLVDAAQSTGVVPIDLSRDSIDAVVTTSMKWLLGPPGVAYLAMRPDAIAATGDVGYVAAGVSDEFDLTSLPAYPAGARRAEVGLAPLPLLPAALAGLRLIEAAGVAAIGARVEALVTALGEGLRRRGYDVLTPVEPRARAGVLAFAAPRATEMSAALRERGVDVWGYPSGRVRVDPHGFNDESDITRFLEEVDRWTRHGT